MWMEPRQKKLFNDAININFHVQNGNLAMGLLRASEGDNDDVELRKMPSKLATSNGLESL